MYIICGNSQNRLLEDSTACALGFFDGVHKGHVNLISELKQLSQNMSIKSMVFTFEKHPLTVLSAGKPPNLITSNGTKAEIFEELGVDIVNFNSVSRKFLNYGPEQFLSEILLKKFNVKALIAGFNFRFGHLGSGDSNFLVEFCKFNNIPVKIVKPFIIDGVLVSSTAIREYIKKGDISKANNLLGRPFSLEGCVSHGMMRGRKLGFKTANLQVDDSIATPQNGVYITSVSVDGVIHGGVTNVGINPTFKNENVTVETHIMDFSDDIYDKKIKVYFHERLRDEVKFKDIEELSKQILKDKQTAIDYLHKSTHTIS